MKNFQFGSIRPHPSGRGTIGQYALHIQCPWRIIATGGIVTGSSDYYEPAEVEGEVVRKDSEAGNLQQKRLRNLLPSYDVNTRSLVNSTGQLVVEAAFVDDLGGFELQLSGGYRLQVFPNGSRAEDWRFFAPSSEEDHLVIEGGRVAPPPSESSES